MITIRTTEPRGLLALCGVWAASVGLALSCAEDAYAGQSGETSVLRYLESLPYEGVDPERAQHLRDVAGAITRATDKPSERAWLLGIGRWEGRS
jgi:hypothetical protein